MLSKNFINMSDNEDLLADELGDHSLADYNLGNDEEEELLADDYDHSTSQNVPTSGATVFRERVNIVQPAYASNHSIEYSQQPASYPVISESECVVPNITTEVPDTRLPEHSTYAPYPDPRAYDLEHAVPPPIPAAAIESPQIVPSEVPTPSGGDLGARERFTSERPPGSQRTPQVRDIPDSLDKVVVPRGGFSGRGRNTWRNPHYRTPHPYRRNNTHRNNYVGRPSFTPQVTVWATQPKIRPNIPDIRSDIPPLKIVPNVSPERPILQEPLRPVENRFPPNFNQFRPNEPRPFITRPPFEPRPPFQYQPSYPRFPPIREIVPSGVSHIPQVTIHQHPVMGPTKMGREPEVRMLPMHLPPNIPPGGLAGKKVLINPHFKGNFQPPVEGPIKDIDDAAERFIAEQRNALARAATRKLTRRSPQRYIENTTIEIENELARRSEEEELLRRQEEFINANRAGLRRRMRSPSPPRRSPSPRRSPPRRARTDAHDEESEYRRRLREQESLRERVLRAKEVRRRKNAVALQKQIDDREHDKTDKDHVPPETEKQDVAKVDIVKAEIPKAAEPVDKPSSTQPDRPDTTRSPEKEVKLQPDRSPVRPEDPEVNSTCENLTPPREEMPVKEPAASPERALTPPLPAAGAAAAGVRGGSDDELDLILDDIDGILSDDDDTGRFKESVQQSEQPKQKSHVDLRSKLVTKPTDRPHRQKIVFEHKEERTKKEKSPARRTVVTSSTKPEDQQEKKGNKTKTKTDAAAKSRTRIIFNKKQAEKPKEEDKAKSQPFSNRRVVLQRKSNQTISMGIFTRAVRTALGTHEPHEPHVEYASESEEEGAGGGGGGGGGSSAHVRNLPPGITHTRLATLAGEHVQNIVLDKEDRSAKLTFKTSAAADTFKKKFHNKMVAASRLTVTLR